MTFKHVALIGFGEVGRILATDLSRAAASPTVSVWDTAFAEPNSEALEFARTLPITSAADAQDAARGADLIISAVTAAQTLGAAASVSGAIEPTALFLDLNSASPQAKIVAAETINQAHGHYVEGALMSPVPKPRLATPILLGGAYAEAAAPRLQALGFTQARFFSESLGRAAAAKLCRSVIVKGMEALVLESLLAARSYGVEETVLESLNDMFPEKDWQAFAGYLIGRTLEHGSRRAEEMHEAARTVNATGLAPLLSDAIAERQSWAAGFADTLTEDNLPDRLSAILRRAAE